MNDYNYGAFSSDKYDFDVEEGPSVGMKAPDFALTTSTGQAMNLLEFDGDLLVLELGSITCPLFQSRRAGMSALSDEFAGVSSAILYVREAHPGAGIPSHTTLESKQLCANRLREEDGEKRTILVDDLKGTAHHAYGGMPNAVFIINRNGCVVFRGEWNNPKATRRAVQDLLAGKEITAKSYFKPAVPKVVFKTLGRAGTGSAPDFFESLPSLIWQNIIKRNLRLLMGKTPKASRDMAC